MKTIFAPESIVVVGGSSNTEKPGGRVLENLRKGGFPKLFVVNPTDENVQGVPTWPAVDLMPEVPDLAVLAVSAAAVLEVVEALLLKGTRSFIVLSAGFSEVDEKGRQLEATLVRRIRDADGHLIGPNSLGIFCQAYAGTFGGLIPRRDEGGNDIISASGATAAFIVEGGIPLGLKFSSLVSVGNAPQYGVEDILAYQDETHGERWGNTKLLYMESLEKPLTLLQHARSLREKGCNVLAWKTGTTHVGFRAASSHTGAMSTPDAAVAALFDKAGITRVGSRAEMVAASEIVSAFRPLEGPNLGIITQAGGPGVSLADALARHGFKVPALADHTQNLLRKHLFPGSATRNPIDILAAGTAQHLADTFRILADHELENLHGIITIFGDPGLFDVWPVFEVIMNAIRTLPIPVYPVLPSSIMGMEDLRRLTETGCCYFTDEVTLADALGKVWKTPPPEMASPELPSLDNTLIRRTLNEARAQGSRQLSPDQVDTILRATGFDIPESAIVHSVDEAMARAEHIGFPLVLKVVGPVHKTDVGGVVTDVRDEDQLVTAFQRIMTIPDAQAVLLQRQVKGLEVILGASYEDGFGHLIMFGLGGIFTEVLRDIQVALAPLSRREARRLIAGIRGGRVLDGLRGRQGVDRERIVDLIVRLSTLVHNHPEIKEMEINPLKGEGPLLRAIDARITLR